MDTVIKPAVNLLPWNCTQLIATTFTMFTCQATVRKNETACSDVIVPSSLHVWKSFTCGRHIGKHLLRRLVTKGMYGVRKHVHWCTDFTNLEIAVHASHEVAAVNYGSCCTLQNPSIADVHWRFTAWVDVTCAKLQAFKFHTGFLSTMLKNIGDYRLILHVSASA